MVNDTNALTVEIVIPALFAIAILLAVLTIVYYRAQQNRKKWQSRVDVFRLRHESNNPENTFISLTHLK
jgi:Na+/H+ antiporter NhaD/arsenite permease-like protein